uniref:Uncharacterized protein n=1 Tax=Candidatus Methanogaster sp. ANME-2c ERB4 TaxID=2759911 RepID=A0A7G9YKL3_9EURY|nr:hypothetical protein JAJEHNPH_00006 [Methanosarcinales archaeon ANME-2c ERB4]QNO48946.1 hypothetical protein OEPDFBKK_00022 [Methanosarcinales archaeon ANME-2c ERB4]
MSGLKWWKVLLIIFIIIFVIRTEDYYYGGPNSGGISVFDVNESVARNGTVIQLTEQDFREHPVLTEVIKGEKPLSRMLRRDGVIADRKELKYLQHRFVVNMSNLTEEKYVEYEGKYYELMTYAR